MTISLATKHRITHDYVLHDIPLPAVSQLKYPGITLQNYSVVAYCTIICPKVENAAADWLPWLPQDVYGLKRLQCRSTRFVSRNYQQFASISDMIKTLGWEYLEDRRKKLRVQMLYKIINNLVILPSTPLSKMEPSCYDLCKFNVLW